jgi:hypothetical protein
MLNPDYIPKYKRDAESAKDTVEVIVNEKSAKFGWDERDPLLSDVINEI